jgi:hypothetical protein
MVVQVVVLVEHPLHFLVEVETLQALLQVKVIMVVLVQLLLHILQVEEVVLDQ